MAKKIPQPSFQNLSYKNYFQMVKFAFLRPKLYAFLIPLDGGFRSATVFFLVNFSIGLFLTVLFGAITSKDVTLFFLGITNIVFLAPIALVTLLAITASLHIVAKLLSGKGSFLTSFRALSYSLIFLIFFSVPVLDLICYLFLLYILTLTFARAHQYSLAKASINVAAPFLITVILAFILGLLNTNSILTI
jgi:hypothetical protein